jgi:hypothetical protein
MEHVAMWVRQEADICQFRISGGQWKSMDTFTLESHPDFLLCRFFDPFYSFTFF